MPRDQGRSVENLSESSWGRGQGRGAGGLRPWGGARSAQSGAIGHPWQEPHLGQQQAAAAGGSVWLPVVVAAAVGSFVKEWDATQRSQAGAPRGRPGHSATGLWDPPEDERQKSDSGTSVGEEAAAATPGRGGDSRSEVRAPGCGTVTA